MIEKAVEFLHTLAIQYGIFGLIGAEIIEEIIVPIPSAAVMMSGGFLFLGGAELEVASLQKLFFGVALPLAVGLVIGSLFIYGLTYYLGRLIIDRYGRWLGLSWGDIEKTQSFFNKGKKDEIFFILVRVIPLVPSVAVNAFAGLTRMPIKKYLVLTFVGGYLRAVLMGFVGWQAGSLYVRYAETIKHIEDAVLYGLIGLVVLFILYRRTKKPSSPPVGGRAV